jgi:hypothetical protein
MSLGNQYFNIKTSQGQVLPSGSEAFISADFTGIADELAPYWRENEDYFKSSSATFSLYGDRTSISSGKRWTETLLTLPVNSGIINVKLFSVETGQLLIKKNSFILKYLQTQEQRVSAQEGKKTQGFWVNTDLKERSSHFGLED